MNIKKIQAILAAGEHKFRVEAVADLHKEAFSTIIVCNVVMLQKYSPRFKNTDIKRISKRLKMKEAALLKNTYVLIAMEIMLPGLRRVLFWVSQLLQYLRRSSWRLCPLPLYG
jgi:hypothetical protein